MIRKKHPFTKGEKGAALAIRLIPRASKNEIVKVMDDGTVRIRITAPPVEGKANRALIKYLSKILDVSQSKIEIVAGKKSKNKLISIIGLNSRTVQKMILDKISRDSS
ncbi:MAG TPA: YggU family protein [Anaerolineae bacterium]|nr:YggU family protein [Anaerolineae bacterium]